MMNRWRIIRNWFERVWSAMREEHECSCECDEIGYYDSGYDDGYAACEVKILGDKEWDEYMIRGGR